MGLEWERKGPWMNEPVLKRSAATVNGVRLFYRDTGPAGPPMLCLHGRWGRGETWTDLISRTRDLFRIIAPDQRGHGLSDKPAQGYFAEDLAADAHELLRSLGAVPAVVVGHSMGGRIAGHIAALYPEAVRAVAILDEPAAGGVPFTPSTGGDSPEDDGLTAGWPTPYPTYDHAIRDLESRFRRESNRRYFLDSLVETEAGYDFLFSRRAMTALYRSYRPWHEMLRRIECPVLLVRAAESWCLSAEEAAVMLSEIRDCTYFEVAGSDHAVYADNPEDFYRGFDAFIRRFA